MKIEKIISGGQTGADQGGLLAGKWCKLETGGYIPKGFRTQAGPAPWLGEIYGLVETGTHDYPTRTKLNALHSDMTIIFGDHKSRGCKLTINLCKAYEKPVLVVNDFHDYDFIKCYRFIMEEIHGGLVINVAGNREESKPGICDKTKKFMIRLIEACNKEF